MMQLKEINKEICGNNYKVYFTDPDREVCKTIYGEMQNFNPCHEVVIYVKNKGLYIFPYSSIISMIPIEESELSEYDKRILGLLATDTIYSNKYELNHNIQ